MELTKEALSWIITQVARLRASHGEAIGQPSLVEPTGKYFPDEFSLDGGSVERLLKRLMSYTPLDEELSVKLGFEEDPEAAKAGGCGSTACGKGGSGGGARGHVVPMRDGYGVVVDTRDVANPVTLTTTLARSVGALVLAEGGEEPRPEEAGLVSEVCAATLGFGILLLNGAALYAKGCGGIKLHQATHLSVPETAALTALVCRVYGHDPSTVKKHLEVTQKEAFVDALAWIDSNPEIVHKLRTAPELLEGGAFEIAPPRGFFGRLFLKKPETELAPRPPTKKVRTPEELRRLEEAKRLVDEALSSS